MFKRVNFYLVSLVILVSFIFFRWLFFQPSAGGDWHYYSPDALRDGFFHFSWVSSFNLGGVDLVLWRFPVDILKSGIGFLGLDSSISDKLIVFFPSVFLGAISSFCLVKKVTNSDQGAFIGAIVFNFNTYFLTANSSILIYGASSWVIFGLISFMKSLENKDFKYAISSSILLFIAAGYDFRVAYIGVFIFFFYLLFFLFVIDRKSIKKYFFLFITSIFTFGLLNFYWIMPMLKAGSLTANTILDRTLFGNEFLNILYSTSLYHPFWTGGEPIYFIPQKILVYFWIVPIIAFLGLYLSRRNKNALFFGIIALLGIFLTKQVGAPFPGVYPWLFDHLPGFNAFREASKFYILTALGFSVLIGSLISWVWDYKYKTKNNSYIKYILFFTIAIFFLWNIKPILTGKISGIYVNRVIPNYYQNISNLLNSDDYYRILWVPNYSRWFFYSDNHPVVGLQDTLDSQWKEYKPDVPSDKIPAGKTMMDVMSKDYTNNLLDLSSIKYIIIPYADHEGDVDIFQYYGKDRNYYIQELSKLGYLHKINVDNKSLSVFENFNYRPHLYLTDSQENLYKSLKDYTSVDFEFINPTRYEVHLKNIKSPVFLNFSEAYHPQWKIVIGSFNWYDALINKRRFIDSKNHKKTDATLNSFYLDPVILCKENDCSKNPDGTYNMDLTLYFGVQSYVYLGFIVSGVVLIISVSYIIIRKRKISK